MKNVQIENQDALTLIKKYNHDDCLIYADPPYVLETRTKRHYAHEMTDTQHEELVKELNNHSGYVLLSGYDNDLYNDILKGWSKATIKNQTVTGKNKQEVLWISPTIVEQTEVVYQQSFF